MCSFRDDARRRLVSSCRPSSRRARFRPSSDREDVVVVHSLGLETYSGEDKGENQWRIARKERRREKTNEPREDVFDFDSELSEFQVERKIVLVCSEGVLDFSGDSLDSHQRELEQRRTKEEEGEREVRIRNRRHCVQSTRLRVDRG